MRLYALRPARRTTAPESPPGAGEPEPSWQRLLTPLHPRNWRRALRHNPGLKLVSLLIAFLLWFTINVTERDAERVVELGVAVRRIEPGLLVTNPPAKPIAVALRGPRTILDGVDERKLRLGLDLSAAEPGDVRVDLAGDMVRPELPRRLKVVRIEPPRIKLRVERLVRRTLPVKIDLAGAPAFGFTVAESQVVPDQVEVTGPAAKVDVLKEVATEAIDLRGLSEPVEREVLLSAADAFVSFKPDQVSVKIQFEDVMVSREFRQLAVRVLGAEPSQIRLAPPRVDLTIRGPQRLLHNYRLAADAVFVDAAGLTPGSHRVAARVDLPAALEVMRRLPETHTLTIGGPRGE